MRLVSPFSLPTEAEAYDAYCAMPHMKKEGAKKPTRKAFAKLYKERHAEHARNGEVSRAKGDDRATLIQQIAEAMASGDAEAIAELLAGGTDATDEAEAADDGEYLEPRDTPEDAASNGVLWRLNKEGLLHEALEDAGEAELDYISQEIGQAVLTRGFGPLAAR